MAKVSKPVRVQLSRKRGWRKPENTVVVSRPSIWGNPYRVWRDRETEDGREWVVGYGQVVVARQYTRDEATIVAVKRFAWRLRLNSLRGVMAKAVEQLRGKNLACWCPLPEPGEPDMCHAAVLLEVANQ